MNLYFVKFSGCKKHWGNEILQECHHQQKNFPIENETRKQKWKSWESHLHSGDLYYFKILIKQYSPY